jgi:hypothetical protein
MKTLLGSRFSEYFGVKKHFLSVVFNNTWTSGWHTTWTLQTHDDRCRDADIRHLQGADEPRNATRHDAGKPTSSVPTPIIATPTQDSTYIGHQPRNDIRHDLIETTVSVAIPVVATPTQDSKKEYVSFGKSHDTTLARQSPESRSLSSRHRQKI